jgi:predicted DNA-binding transcriptional regulator
MKEEILERLGLTKNEIKIYLYLLSCKTSTTGPIIKTLKISSSRVYESLEKLISKGLVAYFLKNNVKYYQAQDPNYLVNIAETPESGLSISLQRETFKEGMGSDSVEEILNIAVETGDLSEKINFSQCYNTTRNIVADRYTSFVNSDNPHVVSIVRRTSAGLLDEMGFHSFASGREEPLFPDNKFVRRMGSITLKEAQELSRKIFSKFQEEELLRLK